MNNYRRHAAFKAYIILFTAHELPAVTEHNRSDALQNCFIMPRAWSSRRASYVNLYGHVIEHFISSTRPSPFFQQRATRFGHAIALSMPAADSLPSVGRVALIE